MRCLISAMVKTPYTGDIYELYMGSLLKGYYAVYMEFGPELM